MRYKRTTSDAANSFKTDAYVPVDAVLRYDWQNLRFAINAEKLLDNRHVACCSSLAFCFYGRDRTVVGSVSYRF